MNYHKGEISLSYYQNNPRLQQLLPKPPRPPQPNNTNHINHWLLPQSQPKLELQLRFVNPVQQEVGHLSQHECILQQQQQSHLQLE